VVREEGENKLYNGWEIPVETLDKRERLEGNRGQWEKLLTIW